MKFDPKVYSKLIVYVVGMVGLAIGHEFSPEEMKFWVELVLALATGVGVYAAKNAPLPE